MHIYSKIESNGYKDYLNKLANIRPATYHDKDCTSKQCKAHKCRSIKDLYRIVNTRYPKVSFGDFFKQLEKICTSKYFYVANCPDINMKTLVKLTYAVSWSSNKFLYSHNDDSIDITKDYKFEYLSKFLKKNVTGV